MSEPAEVKLEFPKVCIVCKEENLVKSMFDSFRNCMKCQQWYCVHFASGVDPIYCKDCCIDVQMTDEKVVVTREHYSPVKDEFIQTRHQYRSLKFTGLDWLFAQRKIATLSEEELSLTIEYHQGLMQGLVNERDKRRVEYFHRNAGKKISIVDANGNDLNTITTTSVKTTKTVRPRSKTNQEVNSGAAMEALANALKGKSLDDIMAFIKKVK